MHGAVPVAFATGVGHGRCGAIARRIGEGEHRRAATLPDGSGSAVAVSTDGSGLLAICAGEVRGTAEIRKVDGVADWATTATVTFPVINDVHPAVSGVTANRDTALSAWGLR